MTWKDLLKNFFENTLRKIIGVFLIVLGIVGLFLPFLQGILLVFIGLALLGSKMARDKIKQVHTALSAWSKRYRK